MSTLYLDRANAELRIDGGALAIYADGSRQGSVPLKLLERVVLRGRQVRLDSEVLLKLADHGVATVVVAPRMAQRVALVLGAGHNDASVRLAQAGAVMDPAYCLAFGHDVVRAKLRHQRRALLTWMKARPDARKPLFDAEQALSAALVGLEERPATHADQLRGMEGAAARAYFRGLAAVLPPAAGFTGRNRRPPRDPVNVCLSLAYTLLHAEAVRACHSAGLDPLLGFYHRPAFGRESLACDLVEPLRSYVDRWVWTQWRDESLRVAQFSQTEQGCLMQKAGRGHFYPAWEGAATLPRRWLRRTCMQLARGFRNAGLPLLDQDNDFER
jgi:CRISPR-associated protein Cas1